MKNNQTMTDNEMNGPTTSQTEDDLLVELLKSDNDLTTCELYMRMGNMAKVRAHMGGGFEVFLREQAGTEPLLRYVVAFFQHLERINGLVYFDGNDLHALLNVSKR